MRASLFVGVFVFVVAMAGCGSSAPFTAPAHHPRDPGPANFAPRLGWSPTIPRSASTPAEIVKALASQDGLGKIVAVKVVHHTQSGVGLSFHVLTDGSGPGRAYADWEATLLRGVIANAFAKRGIRLGIATVTGDLPSGKTVSLDDGSGIGDIASDQDFSNASNAAIKRRLTEVLRRAHLTPISITVLHVGQPAPAIVVETNHPHRPELISDSVMKSLFFAAHLRYRYEGYYIEVESPTGKPVVVSTQSLRTGEGTGWSNSAYSTGGAGPTGSVGPTGPVGPVGPTGLSHSAA